MKIIEPNATREECLTTIENRLRRCKTCEARFSKIMCAEKRKVLKCVPTRTKKQLSVAVNFYFDSKELLGISTYDDLKRLLNIKNSHN